MESLVSTSAMVCIRAVSAFLGTSSMCVLYVDELCRQQGDLCARPVLRFQNRHGPSMDSGMRLSLSIHQSHLNTRSVTR